MQSTSTRQSITMLETTQARAGGCSPKNSRNTALKAAKSVGRPARHRSARVLGPVAGLLEYRHQVAQALARLGTMPLHHHPVQKRRLAGYMEPAVGLYGAGEWHGLAALPVARA